MILKLDLSKAYDKMEWKFVMDCLDLLHFPRHIYDVVQACLSSASVSINWQGRPSQNFSPSHGLRQGDSLSPLLFIIALERLKFDRGGPSV